MKWIHQEDGRGVSRNKTKKWYVKICIEKMKLKVGTEGDYRAILVWSITLVAEVWNVHIYMHHSR